MCSFGPNIAAVLRRTRSESLTPLKWNTAGEMKSSRHTAASELITDDTELDIIDTDKRQYTCWLLIIGKMETLLTVKKFPQK